MSSDAAQLALRARQGMGARYDAPDAPAQDLLLARRGTAYFARHLNLLSDGDLTPARRAVVANVSLQARAMALAVKRLRAPLNEDEAQFTPDLGMTTTLPAHALRYLFDHSQIHLNVEWRDMTNAAWDQPVYFPHWVDAPARDLPIIRAHMVWEAAQKLGTGARLSDIPEQLR